MSSLADTATNVAVTPSFRLDGRRALISGAGRGIGLALATTLAEAGAEVVLADRSHDDVINAAAGLVAVGHAARPLLLDITDIEAVRRTIATEPSFHILVNNAGTNRPKPIAEVSEDDYDAVIGLNLKALYFVCQAVVGRAINAGTSTSIINVSSQMGHVGAPNRSLYCASKHGVEGLTKALAVELAHLGIRVNSIAPTFIETDMTRPFFEDEVFRTSVLGKIKLGRLGKPSDLAGALILLASDAGSLITGTSIVVDGGWTAE
jgi:NAD(P)-dependent dehydrogenase (short-subunit alcohol dehydrogenase family)